MSNQIIDMSFKKSRIFPKYITPFKLFSYFLATVVSLIGLMAVFGGVSIHYPEVLILITVLTMLFFTLDLLLAKHLKSTTSLVVWELAIVIVVFAAWLWLAH